MVSFFGLKIGGDRKKKNVKGIEISAPKQDKFLNHDLLGHTHFVGRTERNGSLAGSLNTVSRPNTSHSNVLSRSITAPYASNNAAAMSLTDLPSPHHFRDSHYANLKQYSSNPNLGMQFSNGSNASLRAPIPPIKSTSRPGTPVKQRPRVDTKISLERPESPVSGRKLSSATSKSPLGQFELNLDLRSDAASLLGGNEESVVKPPEPLRIMKRNPSPALSARQAEIESLKRPPSPPQSVRTNESFDSLVLEKPPIPFKSRARSTSRGSARTGLKAVQNARGLPRYGPAPIPSPLASPRVSEDKHSAPSIHEVSEPVIQTVRARRDTLTINPDRRRSLEIKVAEFERSNMPAAPLHRAKTSTGHKFARPPRLDLNARPGTPDAIGLRSAPVIKEQQQYRPLSPSGESFRGRAREGPPPAARGALGPRVRPDTSAVRRPPVDEYDFRPRSPRRRSEHHDHDDASSMYSRPQSSDFPESPVLPLSGPLAGAEYRPFEYFLDVESDDDEYEDEDEEGRRRSHEHDIDLRPSPLSPSMATFGSNMSADGGSPLIPPRSLSRNQVTPEQSADWPLPSPVVSSFAAATLDIPGAAGRAESPLGPPLIPAARAESPFARRGTESPLGFRSFSRPWTPTNEPLRRDRSDTTTPIARSETAPLPAKRQDPGFLGLRAPPPVRSQTTSNLRSPAVVGNDFGGGYI
ncbi:hypothetical protein F4778DRAFT_392978 [Xylariomycetidae sp. FL2044]|nr:hypothetical protein F4778DRAFT_392978 [Xylariomycetidae sp. FL2044]